MYASAVKPSDNYDRIAGLDVDMHLQEISTTSPDSSRMRNVRLLSDVEKELIQAELAGLEEVYQRVCHVSIKVVKGAISATPLFLFTFGDVIN